jgi:hypothetical protein
MEIYETVLLCSLYVVAIVLVVSIVVIVAILLRMIWIAHSDIITAVQQLRKNTLIK